MVMEYDKGNNVWRNPIIEKALKDNTILLLSAALSGNLELVDFYLETGADKNIAYLLAVDFLHTANAVGFSVESYKIAINMLINEKQVNSDFMIDGKSANSIAKKYAGVFPDIEAAIARAVGKVAEVKAEAKTAIILSSTVQDAQSNPHVFFAEKLAPIMTKIAEPEFVTSEMPAKSTMA